MLLFECVLGPRSLSLSLHCFCSDIDRARPSRVQEMVIWIYFWQTTTDEAHSSPRHTIIVQKLLIQRAGRFAIISHAMIDQWVRHSPTRKNKQKTNKFAEWFELNWEEQQTLDLTQSKKGNWTPNANTEYIIRQSPPLCFGRESAPSRPPSTSEFDFSINYSFCIYSELLRLASHFRLCFQIFYYRV